MREVESAWEERKLVRDTWEQSWEGIRGARETKKSEILKETWEEKNHNAGKKVTLGRKEAPTFQYGRKEKGILERWRHWR